MLKKKKNTHTHKETTKSRMGLFYKTTVLTLTTKCHCKKIWRGYSKIKILTLGKTEGTRRGNREQDGWMASPSQSTWVWGNSRRWWRTGKPGVLQSVELQIVGHDWATEQQQILRLGIYNQMQSITDWILVGGSSEAAI